MKLYYLPGACSLADHIALHEAGVDFQRERVDIKTRLTETGANFLAISRKGYVPALVLDDGAVLTENIAVLDWIAGQYPQLGADGPLGRTRLLEALAYISTEIHRSFKPMWHAGSDADKAKARAAITSLLQLLADQMQGDYLFGSRMSVADCYLFVMLLWADRFTVTIPEPLPALRDRMKARKSVQLAMQHEGLA